MTDLDQQLAGIYLIAGQAVVDAAGNQGEIVDVPSTALSEMGKHVIDALNQPLSTYLSEVLTAHLTCPTNKPEPEPEMSVRERIAEQAWTRRTKETR